MPNFVRAEVSASNTMHADVELPSQASDPDTLYYTKTRVPHQYEVTFSGPFYPVEGMITHIQRRCEKEGSLPAVYLLQKALHHADVVALWHVIAPLPCGNRIKIEVMRKTNSETAMFLRNGPPNTPGTVWSVFNQTLHPDHMSLMNDRWPFEHILTFDVEVLDTLCSKDRANKAARKILAVWNAKKRPGEMIYKMMVEGLFVAQLCDMAGPSPTQKQILHVQIDDGRELLGP